MLSRIKKKTINTTSGPVELGEVQGIQELVKLLNNLEDGLHRFECTEKERQFILQFRKNGPDVSVLHFDLCQLPNIVEASIRSVFPNVDFTDINKIKRDDAFHKSNGKFDNIPRGWVSSKVALEEIIHYKPASALAHTAATENLRSGNSRLMLFGSRKTPAAGETVSAQPVVRRVPK